MIAGNVTRSHGPPH